MIIEIFSVLTILAGGCFLMRTVGVRGWGLPCIGFIAGIALMVFLGEAQLVIGTLPYTTLRLALTTTTIRLVLTTLIPFLLWLIRYKKGRDVSIRVFPSLLVVAGVLAAIFFLRGSNIFAYSPDSFRHAQIGSLIESLNIHSANPDRLWFEGITIGMMQAPANLMDEFYLRSIIPILGLATMGAFIWFCKKALGATNRNWWEVNTLTFMCALLLFTNRYFIYNSFYIHAHMAYASFILLIAGSAWLYARNPEVPRAALMGMICLSTVAAVVTRPEAPMHVGFVLLPVLVSSKIPLRRRALILLVLGLSHLFWGGLTWSKYVSGKATTPLAVVAMFWLGLAEIMLIPFMFSALFDRISKYAVFLGESVLWIALGIAAVKDPEMFFVSYNAMVENVIGGVGHWGYSFCILGILFVMTLLLSNAPDRVFLRFPVTTFIPLGLLLAFFRGSPYHAGASDSFNRMLFHIVPIAILFIASSATTDRWGLPSWMRTAFSSFKRILRTRELC